MKIVNFVLYLAPSGLLEGKKCYYSSSTVSGTVLKILGLLLGLVLVLVL